MVLNKVVVTGAAGFIGGHLCSRLVRDGVGELVGIDSLRSGDWSRTPECVKRTERDISDLSPPEWMDLLEGADLLVHLAAEKYNSSRSTPDRLLNSNVIATERLLRCAAEINVGRVVFSSSLYAYGSMGPKSMSESDVPSPSTLYGASKLMGENILRSIDHEIGLNWNAARLFFIYGPHQHAEGGYKSVIMTNFERMMNGESPVVLGDGQQSLDYVYVDDCIDALMCLATSPTSREMVNVSTGRETSIVDLTEMMLSVAGLGRQVLFGPADWTTGSSRVGEPDKIERVFGWRAQVPLIEGLSRVHHWLVEREV